MGGRGSGGMRLGSGAKPKSQAQHWLTGDAGGRGLGAKDAKPAAPLPIPAAPMHLAEPAKGVWEQLAPFATEARTLTPATMLDFEELCELVIEMRGARQARQAAGWTDEGLKFAPTYRGLVQRVEGKMRSFRLAPIGKEMPATEAKPDDPFAEFEGGGVQ